MRVAPSRQPLSCGCIKAEKLGNLRRTHGHAVNYTATTEYKAWISIKGRCLVPTDTRYRNYGGRGITMFSGWVNDFPAFFAHVGKRPSPLYTLDRIDNDRGYEPGNLRWATLLQQANNTRVVRRYLIRNEALTLSEAAAKYGIDRDRLRTRLNRGTPIERAINPADLPVGRPAHRRP